jgi:hypothetical protein
MSDVFHGLFMIDDKDQDKIVLANELGLPWVCFAENTAQ